MALIALAMPAGAGAHAERATFFPDPNLGAFPEYRTDGPSYRGLPAEHQAAHPGDVRGPARARTSELLSELQLRHDPGRGQPAANGTRILVMPGVYHEDPSGSRAAGCEDVYQRTTGALTYEEHRQCPNAQNLIAILGDTDGDRICDAKCNIQIEGTGDAPRRRADPATGRS